MVKSFELFAKPMQRHCSHGAAFFKSVDISQELMLLIFARVILT
jgi:hypothetical protein